MTPRSSRTVASRALFFIFFGHTDAYRKVRTHSLGATFFPRRPTRLSVGLWQEEQQQERKEKDIMEVFVVPDRRAGGG